MHVYNPSPVYFWMVAMGHFDYRGTNIDFFLNAKKRN